MKKLALSGLLLTACLFQHATGQLFVSDQANNQVLRFNQTTGAFEGVFVPGGNFYSPQQATGLTFGPDGNLYVVGTGIGFVMRYDGSTGNPLPGPNAAPPPPMSATAQFTTFDINGGALTGAQDIVFGPDVTGDMYRDIYVSNGSSNKISVFNGATGNWVADHTLISTLGGSNPAFVGMTVSPSGMIYVVDGNDSPFDSYASDVLRFDPVAGTFTPFVVAIPNQFNFRTAITFSPDGQYLYISNWGGDPTHPPKIERFSGITGTPIDFFTGVGLNQPRGLEFGPDGALYIANFYHNPPTGIPNQPGYDPGTPGLVFRYDGASATQFAVGGNPANFFDVAFPAFTAVPEVATFAIGALISCLLIFHSTRRSHFSLARSRVPNEP